MTKGLLAVVVIIIIINITTLETAYICPSMSQSGGISPNDKIHA